MVWVTAAGPAGSGRPSASRALPRVSWTRLAGAFLEDIVLRLKASLASLAVVVIAASGCSSSGDDGSSSSGGDSAVSNEGVAAAQDATEQNLQAPKTIPLTEPLESTPPTGETF